MTSIEKREQNSKVCEMDEGNWKKEADKTSDTQALLEQRNLRQMLFDTHCHIHLTSPRGYNNEDAEEEEGKGEEDYTYWKQTIPHLLPYRMATMATSPKDWQAAKRMSLMFPEKILMGFGVHPWFAHTVVLLENLKKESERGEESRTLSGLRKEEWKQVLEDLLMVHPKAIVGEIGLDKVATTPETGKCEFDLQIPVFEYQLDLAYKLQRPVSIHCVRSFGVIYSILKTRIQKLPPVIIFHSYTGSIDWMQQQLLTLPKHVSSRFYFGFSSCINLRSPKIKQVIEVVPEDRLLLETDQVHVRPVNGDIAEIVRVFCEVRRWSVEKTLEITYANATRIFNFSS